MADILLREVFGEGLGPFYAPFRYAFPAAGAVMVRGLNHDTGGSSAAGKTSFVQALGYLFGGCPHPGTALQNWEAAAFHAGAVLGAAGGDVRVQRGSKGLHVGPVKGKAAEAALDQLFGLPEALRAAATYRRQGSTGGLFLGLSNEAKLRLLTGTLGLQAYETAARAAGEAVKGLKDAVIAALAKESAAADQLEACQAALLALPAAAPVDEEAEAAYRAAAGEARLKMEALAAEAQGAEALYRRACTAAEAAHAAASKAVPLVADAPEVAAAEAAVQAAEAAAAEVSAAARAAEVQHAQKRHALRAELQRKQAVAAQLPGYREQWGRLCQQVAVLEAATCPTCERPWAAAEAATALAAAVTARDRAQAGLAATAVVAGIDVPAAQAALDALPDFQEDPEVARRAAAVVGTKQFLHHCRAVADSRGAKQRQQLDALRGAALQRAREACDAVKYGVAAGTAAIRAALQPLHEAKQAAAAAREAAAAAAALRTERAGAAAAATTRHAEARAAIAVATATLHEELDLVALVGRQGFLGAYPDDALADVAAGANALLAQVANVRHVAFSFESERETGAGSLDRRIVPVVTIRGATRPFESGLSGGMQAAVGLAVDFAFRAVVRKRAAAYPNWLVLDEAFDGLDRVSKETCMEILQAAAADSLLLVIDHATEFQGLFSQTLQVESRDGRSWLSAGG